MDQQTNQTSSRLSSVIMITGALLLGIVTVNSSILTFNSVNRRATEEFTEGSKERSRERILESANELPLVTKSGFQFVSKGNGHTIETFNTLL